MNPAINLLTTETLSDDKYLLKKITYAYKRTDGSLQKQSREVYDRGNGATILLYDPAKKTVILTRQFRLPTYVNGNTTGMLVEACAGLLDNESPEEGIKRETAEETGYHITAVQKVFEAYMSPGSVTEMLHFFIAPYDDNMKATAGGGIDHEEEQIEVLEIRFEKAMQMIETGEIKDAKTIMLLQYLQLKSIL